MAERLLLEGSDLAELMSHVRNEFGPHVKIIRAERVRQGGFAGFFAKEKYELTVDVPQMPPVPARPLRSHRPPPSSLEDLLDAADEADHSLVPDASSARAAIVARPDQAAQAAKPRAATAGAQFATVLDQVRALADEGVPAEAFTPMVPAAVAPTVAADLAHPVAPPVPATAPVPGLTGTVPDGAGDSGERLRAALTGLGVPAQLLGGARPTLAGVLDAIPPGPTPPRGAGQVLAVVGAAADLAAVVPLLMDRMRLNPSDLVEVGGPPRAPSAGVVPDLPTRVNGANGLTAWRARAATARHPWVVAVPVSADAEGRAIAAEQVDACRPDQVWAVVDARLKTVDAVHWIDQVGARRPVDALAVRSLMDTAAPGTVLGLGRPVAWVDGLPTSRLVWAAVLGQPLDAALG
ncbi:MAG: hypothetical protein KJ792_06950 [Actinobacteria bacterium]|nr:hypothetical protein [Actinomycetota bacterium]MCG2801456.1 hypothetical protein [Cellulomonas sp.]